ncbi:MAG: type II toxin-antitoxin system HicB family antitoxin [Nitrospinota bacterium]|nr:type II toxin-antitoxin system HicB family antitoxin [Nitrospinota bacterium]
MKVVYPAEVNKGKNGQFTAFLPDFPDIHTEGGKTTGEALENASRALTFALEKLVKKGMDIPHPGEKGKHLVAPAARVQAAILLRFARGSQSIAQIARALDTSWPSAQKLEDPTHSPSLRSLEKAAAAMGKKLIIEIKT